MKKTIVFILCMLCLNILSCEKDDNTIPPVTSEEEAPVIPEPINFEENFGTSVIVRFFGRVIDEQNMPVQGATVFIGNTITTTDLFGVFSGTDTTAFEKFAYVTVEKDGYVNGSRAIIPSATEVNNVEIMLLKEDVIATITSGETATVSLPNGTEVSFDGNFIRESGTTFNGQVDVIIKHLSPDDENMEAMMPGMLFAQNASGDAVALETYGMLAVELRSSSGEELQLADGSTSQLTMPLAANTSNPPATIPLWYFDEEEGYWKEEGEATLQGNKYVGDVTHFSFWNYDYPYAAINLCITLVDEDGNLLPYTSLDIYSVLLNATGTYGYTNTSGTECGFVPQGEQLTITTATTHCDNEPFTTTIGPFATDTNITITVPSSQSVTEIIGTFVDCGGNNITNGYIQLFIDGTSQTIPVTDGTISYTIAYCNTLNFSAKGINIANNQITAVLTGTLDGSTTIDIGSLSSCTGFVDTDEDGVFDSFEDTNGDNDITNDDTDDDGTPNYLDIDDDGDGINTIDENYDGDNDPTNDDTDGDGIPDYLDAVDVNIFDSEIIATGCDPLIFDLVTTGTQYDNTNMSSAFYETEADANAETNALTATYEIPLGSFVEGANIYVKVTNTITSATALASVYLVVVDALDVDNDGLTDCEEITGVDNPDTVAVPSGTSDPNDMNDPIDFTDSDGDGLTDLEETTGNDNPLTILTPNGTSDPNDFCDPIETSSSVDSDNDGLTDCEEITGINNIITPITPNGTSDPNDPNDPYLPQNIVSSVNSPSVNEDSGTVTTIISLSAPKTTDTDFYIEIDSNLTGTASGSDFSGNFLYFGITIPAGDTQVSLPTVTIINDALIESNETIHLNVYELEPGTGVPASSDLSVITIIDDDPNTTLPTMHLSVYSPVEDEFNASVTLSLSEASTEDITIDMQTIDGTATGSVDYGIINSTMIIPAGDISLNIQIPITDDSEVEGLENFFLEATVTSANTANLNELIEIEIYDDDAPTTIVDFPACRNPLSGAATFDIQSMVSNFVFIGDLQSGILVFNYYYTEQGALSFSDSDIVQGPLVITQNTMIYASVWNPHSTPTAAPVLSILNCIINETPIAPTGLNFTVCDGNADGFATFDLSQLDAQIIQTQTGLVVTYYETAADAENNTNPLANNYTNNVANQQVIFYRVEDSNTGCFSTESIDLIVDSGC